MKKYLRVGVNYVKENLELFIVPILFLVILLLVKYAWTWAGFPTQNDIIVKIQGFFVLYGLWVVFISSILEGMLFVGWYFPGSLVIFLGVSSASGNPILAIKTILAVTCGMLIAYTFNFFLGKYGWYKILMKFGFKDELIKIEGRVKKLGLLKGAFIFYIYPGTSSLISTALGILKFNYFSFLSFTTITIVIWNSVWGFAAYHYGMQLFKILTSWMAMFFLFCAYFFYIYNKQKQSIIESNAENKTG